MSDDRIPWRYDSGSEVGITPYFGIVVRDLKYYRIDTF
jgi:hypothetical protein